VKKVAFSAEATANEMIEGACTHAKEKSARLAAKCLAPAMYTQKSGKALRSFDKDGQT
jgi:hypothetical protein